MNFPAAILTDIRRQAAYVGLAAMFGAASISEAQTFSDATTAAGIGYHQYSTLQTSDAEPHQMSGGAAAGDYNGDGLVDLFVTVMDGSNILYRNQGDGTFQSVFGSSVGINVFSGCNGAAWADIDNDGDLDLYITTIEVNRNYLYLNNGFGFFTESAIGRGVAIRNPNSQPQNGFGVALGDYDRDGFLDMFVGCWADFGGLRSRLLRNHGRTNPGSFSDATPHSGIVPTGQGVGYYFSPRFADLDNDGWPELVCSSDFGTSQLFWNDGDGTFTDGTIEAGVGSDENGMGSTIGDFDGDGLLDWFVTSIYNDTAPVVGNWGITGNRLYRNTGNRSFTDVTDVTGVRQGGWGWGTSFLDYDNDGDLDLIMTNGQIFEDNEADEDEIFNHDPMRLWRNNGNGTFTEVSAAEGITDTRSGKGLLTFDYDRDGDLDVFVVNNANGPILYRNNTANANAWLRVNTVGTLSNRDGIGARVTVTTDLNDAANTTQVREIDGGSNFLGQNERAAHFGLGELNGTIDLVTVRWPSGTVQSFSDVPANTTLEARETMTFDAWKKRHFNAAELLDENVSGTFANPDLDELSNFEEYARGFDPRRHGSNGTQTNLGVTDMKPTMTTAFLANVLASDLSVSIEIADNITGPWTPAEGINPVQSTGDIRYDFLQFETVGVERKFVRRTVTLTPPPTEN